MSYPRSFWHPPLPASTQRNLPRSPPAHGPKSATTPTPSLHRNTSPKNASGSPRAEVESGSPDYAGSAADSTHRPGQHDTKTPQKQLTGCDRDRGAQKNVGLLNTLSHFPPSAKRPVWRGRPCAKIGHAAHPNPHFALP